MKQTNIGIIVVIIAVILFLTTLSLTQTIINLRLELHKTCPLPPEACPYKSSVPIESVAAFVLVIIIGIFGVFLIFSPKEIEKIGIQKQKLKGIVKTLRDEEQKMYKIIAESNGLIFQNELIEKTGFSKVKITRILDTLESKGLVERRRRGMSNIVVLK